MCDGYIFFSFALSFLEVGPCWMLLAILSYSCLSQGASSTHAALMPAGWNINMKMSTCVPAGLSLFCSGVFLLLSSPSFSGWSVKMLQEHSYNDPEFYQILWRNCNLNEFNKQKLHLSVFLLTTHSSSAQGEKVMFLTKLEMKNLNSHQHQILVFTLTRDFDALEW